MGKKKKALLKEVDTPPRESLNELAEAYVEQLHEQHANLFEPFELYSERIRMKLYQDFDQFRMRLSKGYEVLLDEIERETLKK
jgi:hypothetical protein